jgi:heme exporter protein CcmD
MPDFHVGKYGAYIWPAYGITVLVFLGLIVSSLWRARRWRRIAERRRRP